ncbi:hypothetical protein COLO4_06051 [Corchorus olitorius]|uniref:Uncharacterized protein n=1 Tax=Corchorus olitorius TaxID=93759 RepID=A0A1R3KP57_9ROSI|nr:hypothetical protein COLO4_06051 [Corchorus olitorius]
MNSNGISKPINPTSYTGTDKVGFPRFLPRSGRCSVPKKYPSVPSVLE